MKMCWWAIAFWVDIVGVGQAPSIMLGPFQLERTNHHLHGQLLDFTHNHGHDRRIWSRALCQKRDLYVYLPPGFDPNKRYPLTIFLHGAAQDEQFFLQTQVINFDRAMACGKIPPAIIVAPDGSLKGRPTVIHPATFFANSQAGRFEDYIMCDVWQFVMNNFPIHPAREAHALAGVSMGGSAAFALAIKHRDRVRTAIGVHPLLNLRYVDCHGKYRTPFDPCCWSYRQEFRGWEAMGRRRLFTLRYGALFQPIFGKGPQAIDAISHINPIELMDMCNLQPGELDLYVAYAGKDEFNVAAQVESFLYRAKERGIPVTVHYEPNGGHDLATARRMAPVLMNWVASRAQVLAEEANGR